MNPFSSRNLCALAFAGLVAGNAAADSNFGIKAGVLSVEDATSDAVQAGFVYTADIMGMFGFEADAHISATKGEFLVAPLPPQDFGVTQFGLYGVFMTPGPVYLKAKAGVAYSDLDVANTDATTDATYGVGAGFELFGVACEVEYTLSKVDFLGDTEMVSFSIKF